MLPVFFLYNTSFTWKFSNFICSFLQIIVARFTEVEQNYANIHSRLILMFQSSNFDFSNYVFCCSPYILRMNIRIICCNRPRPLLNPCIFTVDNTFSFSFLQGNGPIRHVETCPDFFFTARVHRTKSAVKILAAKTHCKYFLKIC
jgi:hypothetical protein